ncbi:hypothetical protein [Moraxella catarrhalis]|nr:hypothetical protein [Moraxella catarrhalis]
MTLTEHTKRLIHTHAKTCHSAECCGLIIDGQRKARRFERL